MGGRKRWDKGQWEMEEVKREPARMCATSGKRMYANEGEAKATAAHQMRGSEAGSVKLRTYKCIYCGAWHLTSKTE